MTTFQVILLVVLVAAALLVLASLLRGMLSLVAGLGWLVVMGVGVVAVIRPSLTTDVAKVLGIGRGVDLLLYCTIVVSMLGFLLFYIRLRRLRREMTLLVRRLAVEHAWSDESASE